jgi:hypothetical protein
MKTMKTMMAVAAFTLATVTVKADEFYRPWGLAPDGFIVLAIDPWGRLSGPPGVCGAYQGQVDRANNGELYASDGKSWVIRQGKFYGPTIPAPRVEIDPGSAAVQGYNRRMGTPEMTDLASGQ